MPQTTLSGYSHVMLGLFLPLLYERSTGNHSPDSSPQVPIKTEAFFVDNMYV